MAYRISRRNLMKGAAATGLAMPFINLRTAMAQVSPRVLERRPLLSARARDLVVAEGWPAVPPALLDEGVERATDRRAEERSS